MEITPTGTTAGAAVTFTKEGGSDGPPVSSRKGKYDALLNDDVCTFVEAAFGQWFTWKFPNLLAANRAALKVRQLGKFEGGSDLHLVASGRQDDDLASTGTPTTTILRFASRGDRVGTTWRILLTD